MSQTGIACQSCPPAFDCNRNMKMTRRAATGKSDCRRGAESLRFRPYCGLFSRVFLRNQAASVIISFKLG